MDNIPENAKQNIEAKQQIERRNLISSVFVATLFAIAYSEMISAVKDSLHTGVKLLETLILLTIFFVTCTRFFIGNQLHLISSSLVKLPGKIWFYDFVIILIETIILIFIGGMCCPDIIGYTKFGFIELLLLLCAMDAFWIFSQWLFTKISDTWYRPFIPWPWMILNITLIIGIVILWLFTKNPYSLFSIIALCVLSVTSFIVDVLLIDYYDLL